MGLVLFEDGAFRTLAPLCHSRPAFLLRAGAFTASERAAIRFGDATISYLCRDYLAPSVAKVTGSNLINKAPEEDSIFLNGAALLGGDLLSRTLDGMPVGSALVSDGRLLAAKAGSGEAFGLFGYIKVLLTRSGGEAGGVPPVAESVKKLGLDVEETDLPVARFPWQLVSATEALVAQDWSDFKRGRSGREALVAPGAHIVEADSVHIGSKVRVEAGAVIDASEGPVILDDEARVCANAVIYGPCYVGRKTSIKAGSAIYGPCSFGPVCKLGGEIAKTVIQGNSNKQHEGFLGHAFLGEWVNLGAGTEVSDLKNNYGPVKVRVDNSTVDSGEMFVGPTIGDHSKTGINSMLNTGAVIGFCCNVFGSGYLPKFIPSFSWGGAEKLVEHDPRKALETARVVMSRRGMALDEVEEALFRKIYEITRGERGQHMQ